MTTCIILNPNAGSADELTALRSHLPLLGPYTVRQAAQPGDAERLARRAVDEGFDTVIAAGGDGTANQVINGLLSPPQEKIAADLPTFGILPLGTGNDFARTLGMPLDDLVAMIEVLADGRTVPADVARVESDPPGYFLNAAGCGFSAQTSENLSKETKKWWGTLGYVLEGARTLPELQECRITLSLDDERLNLAAYNVMIANGRTIGGGTPVAPRARIDDGRLDVIVLPTLPLTQLVIAVPKILTGTHTEADGLIIRQAGRVHLQADPPMPLNLDGESAGQTPVEITVVPRALNVIHA